jgi:hypothetical protein
MLKSTLPLLRFLRQLLEAPYMDLTPLHIEHLLEVQLLRHRVDELFPKEIPMQGHSLEAHPRRIQWME